MAKKEINVEVGARIRERRERNGWSRDYLAEVTDFSVRYVGMVEVGASGVSLEGLRLFAAKLCVSVDYLLNGTDDKYFKNIVYKLEQLQGLHPQHSAHVESLIDAYVSGIKLASSAGK